MGHRCAAGLPSFGGGVRRALATVAGVAESVGLEELTSSDFVPDHWIEITLIGAS